MKNDGQLTALILLFLAMSTSAISAADEPIQNDGKFDFVPVKQ